MGVRFTPGGVLKVVTESGDVAYAVFMRKSSTAFYAEAALTEVRREGRRRRYVFTGPPLFITWVANAAYAKGRWGRVLGKVHPDDLPDDPVYFRQDSVTLEHCWLVDHRTGLDIRPADPHECVGLEPAAAWDDIHVESRITDHYAGRPNDFFEITKVELPGERIPEDR
ncbi:hypothetical protein BZB76_3892 [Actinomadura pelletieri DSM 43383]|uniref:Immunity protein 26 of polymorphic toxin system n=1 Tax=Actinomadura pelletieri DSM 43383 TaxID=1120940 RepID=A0A495QKV7_9ACTN|nr:hypothetical protein [Actinomadura pelletieri]RKS73202.1 hypothetical protein BZB76_3892 [Actinomadura pelletieri DSM 43383]